MMQQMLRERLHFVVANLHLCSCWHCCAYGCWVLNQCSSLQQICSGPFRICWLPSLVIIHHRLADRSHMYSEMLVGIARKMKRPSIVWPQRQVPCWFSITRTLVACEGTRIAQVWNFSLNCKTLCCDRHESTTAQEVLINAKDSELCLAFCKKNVEDICFGDLTAIWQTRAVYGSQEHHDRLQLFEWQDLHT